MRVRVDTAVCTGHGRCYVLAPEVFASDDHGHCELSRTDVEGVLLEAARVGEANCPEQAISVSEE